MPSLFWRWQRWLPIVAPQLEVCRFTEQQGNRTAGADDDEIAMTQPLKAYV